MCFEITERFASSGNISVAESMSRLEALGCEVALDDFGGHAPYYGYLRTVPAHYFKIDSALAGAGDYAQGFLLGRPSSLSGYDFEGRRQT